MKWITHQTGAVALAIAMQWPAAGIVASALGAVAPDMIDQKISKLGRNPKERQKIFNKIHRGHSHWFGWWALALVAAMAYSPPWLAKDALLGFALGGLSHILLDTLTPQGTPLLPFSHKTRLSLNLCRTGSAGEYIFLVLMIVACAFAYGDAFAHYLEKAAYYLRSMKGIF